tara:strand:+ start:660 stop:782 length:123 start_codon:yes stop_codon:yes gene_type:complete
LLAERAVIAVEEEVGAGATRGDWPGRRFPEDEEDAKSASL